MKTSPPATPPAEPPSKRQCRFKDEGFPAEWAEDYRPGGFHPVHFGDIFKDGRYKVIRKLGDGSFSTVWLVVDNDRSQFSALKIMCARSSSAVQTELSIYRHLADHAQSNAYSKHVTALLDTFEHIGPNGTHRCMVFEVMGPSVASMVNEIAQPRLNQFPRISRYPKDPAKKILKHALYGLAILHENGVVHGDLQAGNMLFLIPKLSIDSESKLHQDKLKISGSLRRRDHKIDLWAPRYLALSQSLHDYVDVTSDTNIKLSDFGAAFWKHDPPKSTVTPVALRAPEIIFHEAIGKPIDIWAFGCLVYEFITGTQLFSVSLMGDDKLEDADDDHILDFIDILRPLPDRLMAMWPRKDKWIGNEGERLCPPDRYGNEEDAQGAMSDDEDAESSEGSESKSDVDGDDEAGGNQRNGTESVEKQNHDDDTFSGDVNEEAAENTSRSDPDIGFPADDYVSPELPDGPLIQESLEALFAKNKPDDIDTEEGKVITDLIREILQYSPSDRPTATQLLQHPWFKDT